jgi:outer membrane protein assembly factor BamA
MYCNNGGGMVTTLDMVRPTRCGIVLQKNSISKLFWFFLAFIAFPDILLAAQNDTFPEPMMGSLVHIDSIKIDGNRRTRTSYILRELDFRAGDMMPGDTLFERLEFNRIRLLNTGLFTRVDMEMVFTEPDSSRLHLHFTVYENLFIIPVPVFELADRNFNVWWKEFNHSFKRVNYGLDLSHLNFTGQADVLKMAAIFGYSNKYSISYKIPYINRKQTIGFQTSLSYSRSREVAFDTEGNKLQFEVDPENWQITRWYANAGISWRPEFFSRHTLVAEYHLNRVSENIATDLNPDFFLNGQTQQRHISLIYNLVIDYRDIHPYPLKGYRWAFEVRGNGLLPSDDLRLFRFYAEYNKYFSFNKYLSLETIFKARTSLPRRQPPYFNNQALGYGGNFVRGYEYFVADGLDFGLVKTSFHVELLNTAFDLSRLVPFRSFRLLPVKVYLSLNNDLGYAQDAWYGANNPLSNRLMYGYGVGLDIVAFYNKTARFEYSWNDLGHGGFYLNINTGF